MVIFAPDVCSQWPFLLAGLQRGIKTSIKMACSEFSVSKLIPRSPQNKGSGNETGHPWPLSRAPETRPRPWGNILCHFVSGGADASCGGRGLSPGCSVSLLCSFLAPPCHPRSSARLVTSLAALPRPTVASKWK